MARNKQANSKAYGQMKCLLYAVLLLLYKEVVSRLKLVIFRSQRSNIFIALKLALTLEIWEVRI